MNIDLQKFCATEIDQREHLRTPFRDDVGIVATNGHVLIVLNDTSGDYPDVAPQFKGEASSIIEKIQHGDIWVRVSDIPLPIKKDCPGCSGCGHVWVYECDECEGVGFDHGSHTYACWECKGMGQIRCKEDDQGATQQTCIECSGHGDVIQTVEVRGAWFQRRYLALLAELPNCEITPTSPNAVALFRFDGGVGALMPCYGPIGWQGNSDAP